MIPAKFAPLLFSFCLSIIMSCVVSGVATLNAAGLDDGFAALWLAACTGNRLVLPDDAFLCIIGSTISPHVKHANALSHKRFVLLNGAWVS